MISKLQGILIALIIMTGSAVVYLHYEDAKGTQAAIATEDAEDDVDTSDQTDSVIFASVSINNTDWGHITVIVDTFNDSTATLEAVPHEGCSFVAWFDHNNAFISMDTRIGIKELDSAGTKAVFIDQASDSTKMVSYSWQMPTFQYEDGEMLYQPMVYSSYITDSEYEAYKDADVYRKAVMGNVYLTPWQLITDDPAVKDICAYLEPLVQDLSNLKKAWVVMCFVQDTITYKTDSANYGQNEYWAFPIEAMYTGYGDCEDTAVMFCAIGSKLGLDTGLVSFSYSDSERKNLGHMGAAVALVGDENIINAVNDPIFTFKDVRYCYVETATDSRLDLGYLLKYPNVDAYRILDGGFTHMIYTDGEGFDHESLTSIGSSYDTSSPVVFSDVVYTDTVYGDDFSNPPTVVMNVGDTFSYIPKTNLPCVFYASGDGLVEDGGPFTFNSTTNELSGKVTSEGVFHVVIKAVWTAEEDPTVSQTVYQYITFEVSESSTPNYGGAVKTLSFVDGSWNVATASDGSQDASDGIPDNQGIDTTVILVVAAMIVIIAAVVIRL